MRFLQAALAAAGALPDHVFLAGFPDHDPVELPQVQAGVAVGFPLAVFADHRPLRDDGPAAHAAVGVFHVFHSFMT